MCARMPTRKMVAPASSARSRLPGTPCNAPATRPPLGRSQSIASTPNGRAASFTRAYPIREQRQAKAATQVLSALCPGLSGCDRCVPAIAREATFRLRKFATAEHLLGSRHHPRSSLRGTICCRAARRSLPDRARNHSYRVRTRSRVPRSTSPSRDPTSPKLVETWSRDLLLLTPHDRGQPSSGGWRGRRRCTGFLPAAMRRRPETSPPTLVAHCPLSRFAPAPRMWPSSAETEGGAAGGKSLIGSWKTSKKDG